MGRLAAALFVTALAFVTPKVTVAADTATRSHPVSIPQQALGSALRELAEQSGVQIIFFSEVTQGRNAPALSGTFTTEEALRTLLDGTGLTFNSLNERTLEVFAQSRPAVGEASDARRARTELLSEIEINAQREKLWRMRAEMTRIEEKFFDEYNTLNTRDEFDIFCDLPSGPGIRSRYCRPVFVTRAMVWMGNFGSTGGSADAGLWATGSSLVGSAVGHVYGHPMEDQRPKWDAYEAHMLALINRSPELRAMIRDREAIEKRYKEIRKQKLKGKLFIFE
jgi:hypothetical protein